MKINRQRHRPLEVSIGGLANRDPMFSGHWYGADDTLPAVSNAMPDVVTNAMTPFEVSRPSEPVLVPVDPELLHLLPEPAVDPNQAKWEHVIAIANDVNAVLKGETDFDSKVLLGVVCGLIDTSPTANDIIAAYRKRMTEKRNG